jgi:hypothetical protein
MSKLIFTFIALILVLFTTQAQQKSKDLFNGKNLAGWETYIGPIDEKSKPIGLYSDPLKIFSVVDQNGEKLLRISGEVNASIATNEEFENYHLTLIFKWGEKVYTKKNSGLLYHSFGNYGEGLGVWMSSHELQLWTGHIGDSYCMGSSYFEIPAVKSEDGKGFVYSPDGDIQEFGEGRPTKIGAKSGDFEKPSGELNVIELYCVGRTSVHVVNGQVNMVNYNSGKLVDGKVEPLTKGKIQLQSEGGELFVKRISIETIDKIPSEFLK